MTMPVLFINAQTCDDTVVRTVSELPEYQVQTCSIDNLPKQKPAGDTIIVLCVGERWESELAAVAQHSRVPLTIDLVVAQVADPALSRQVVRLGVKDYLPAPLDMAELIVSLKSVARERVEKMATGEQGGSTVSAFINVKGGAGATFLATNIAQMLGVLSQRKTALLDLDIQFGGASSYLDLAPPNSLVSALQVARDLDRVGLMGYLARHRSGISLLGAGHHELMLLEEVQAGGLENLIALLRDVFGQVVIDVPRYMNLLTVTALQQADRIFLVLQQNLSHMSDALKLIKTMREDLYIEDSRISVVVNRYDKKHVITLRDIEKTLKVRAVDTVPNDFKVATASLNNAEPVFEFARGRPIHDSLVTIENRLGGLSSARQAGLFQRLFNND